MCMSESATHLFKMGAECIYVSHDAVCHICRVPHEIMPCEQASLWAYIMAEQGVCKRE